MTIEELADQDTALRSIWQVVHRDVLAELLAAAAWHHDEYGFDTIDYEEGDQAGGRHKDAVAHIERLRDQCAAGTLPVLTKDLWEGTE